MSTASGVPEANAPVRRSDVQIVRYEKYIDNELRKTRRQVRMVDLTWGGMALLTGALAYLFAVALVDQWVVAGGLGHVSRAAALFLFLAGAIGWIAWAVAPLLFRRINPIYAANAIEQARPSLKNGLVNFLMLRGHPESISPAVYAQIEKQAATGLSQAPLENTVDRSHLLKLAYVLLAIVAVLAIYKVASPKDPIRSVRRVLAPWADIAAPTRVRINDVEPRGASAFHGRFVKVSAEITGLRRDEAPQLFFSTTDGQVVGQSVSMNVPPGELRHVAELPPNQGGLQQNMEYWIVAGDATTPRYPIRVLTTPSIVVESIEYRPPGYTELAPYTVDKQGDISALEGTVVVIHAAANEDIKTAGIDFDCNGSVDTTMQVDGRKATITFPLVIKKNGDIADHASYQLRFTNNDGEENPEPLRYKIEVTPDRPPEIIFTEPIAKDDEVQTIAPNEMLKLVVQAADPDFNLKDVKVVIERNAIKLPANSLLPAPQPKFNGDFVLDAKSLQLKPGDKIEYWAEAIDNKLPNPNKAQTSKRQLRVAALDPKRPNHERQPGAHGDPDQANAGGDQNPNPDPRNPKNETKPGDRNPRNQQDRRNDGGPAKEPSKDPRQEDDPLGQRETVDNPREADKGKLPEDPEKRDKPNKGPKQQRDPSKADDQDPKQQNPADGADQPKAAQEKKGDAPKEEPQRPDTKADPGKAFKNILDRMKEKQQQENPPQEQNPQKNPPQKDPQKDQEQPQPSNPEQQPKKPKQEQQEKKDDGQQSPDESNGGGSSSGKGKDKGDGQSDGGEPGEQTGNAAQKGKNPGQADQRQPGGAGDQAGGDDGNDKTQTGQPQKGPKNGKGKSPDGAPKGDGAGADPSAAGKGANPDKSKDPKNGGSPAIRNEAGKDEHGASKPNGKDTANKSPDGKGDKPVGERRPKDDPGANPGGKDSTDPKQGDGLRGKDQQPGADNKPGDPKVGEKTKGDQQATGKTGASDKGQEGNDGTAEKNPGQEGAGGKDGTGANGKPPKPGEGVGEGPSSGKPGQPPKADGAKPGEGDSADDKAADPNARTSKDPPKSAEGAKYDNNPADPNDPNAHIAPADAEKPDKTGGNKKPSPTTDKTGQPRPGEEPSQDPKASPGKQQGGPKPSKSNQGDTGQQPSSDPTKSPGGSQEDKGASATKPNDQGNKPAGGASKSKEGSPKTDQGVRQNDQTGKDQNNDKPEGEGGPQSPSTSNKPSKTQGEQGDQSGAGGPGGGQPSSGDGTGTAGKSTEADSGAGEGKTPGEGETTNQGGAKQPGKAEQGAKPGDKAGSGSTTRPGQQERAGQSTVQREQPGGKGAGSGESREGVGRGNPTGGNGLSSDAKAANNPPPEERPNGPVEDEANLEYAKKQTDLALEYLKDQLAKGKPDQKLLDDLNWSREDMESFVKQWERFKKQANAGDPAERKQFEQRLEDLGLRPKSTSIKGGAAQDHRNQVLRDSKRSEPPPEYKQQYRVFSSGGAKK